MARAYGQPRFSFHPTGYTPMFYSGNARRRGAASQPFPSLSGDHDLKGVRMDYKKMYFDLIRGIVCSAYVRVTGFCMCYASDYSEELIEEFKAQLAEHDKG